MSKKYSTRTQPFKHLDNDHLEDLIIDDVKYASVTNYIASTLVKSVGKKMLLRNAQIKSGQKTSTVVEFLDSKGIWDIVAFYREEEKIMFYTKVLKDAYSLVLQRGDDNTLVNLKKYSKFIYESNNPYLGINEKGKGLNLLGKTLSQLSKYANTVEKAYANEQKIITNNIRMDTIYNIAYKINTLSSNELATVVFTDNKENGPTLTGTGVGGDIIPRTNKEVKIQKIANGLIVDPKGTIAALTRQKVLDENKKKVFDLFLIKIFNKDDSAINKFKRQLEARGELENKISDVYDVYRVQTEHDSLVTNEDIKAVIDTGSVGKGDSINTVNNVKDASDAKPEDFDDNILKILQSHNIKLKKKETKKESKKETKKETITFSDMGRDAFSVLFGPSNALTRNGSVKDYIQKQFNKNKSIFMIDTDKIGISLESALGVKFEKTSMLDLLLSKKFDQSYTPSRKVNHIVSVIDKKTNDILKRIQDKRFRTPPVKLGDFKLFNLLIESAFVKDWMTRKVNDMCKMATSIYDHVHVIGKDDQIDVKFVKNVVETFWEACCPNLSYPSQNFKMPTYFRSIVVEKCKLKNPKTADDSDTSGDSSGSVDTSNFQGEDVIPIYWSFIKILFQKGIDFMHRRSKSTTFESREFIELITSSTVNNKPFTAVDVDSAITNIINGIISIEKKENDGKIEKSNKGLTKECVMLAVKILNGSEIKDLEKDPSLTSAPSKIYIKENSLILNKLYTKELKIDNITVDVNVQRVFSNAVNIISEKRSGFIAKRVHFFKK